MRCSAYECARVACFLTCNALMHGCDVKSCILPDSHHIRRKRLKRRRRTAVFSGSFVLFVSPVGQKHRYPARSTTIRRHLWYRAEKSVAPVSAGATESSASCQIVHHIRRKRRKRRGRTAVFSGSFVLFVSPVGQKHRYPARSTMIGRHVWHRAELSVTPVSAG